MNRPSRATIERAAASVGRYLAPTPFRRSVWLTDLLQADVFLKLECTQPTGSFKVRGAFARLLAERESSRGPLRAVAASTGNHGCAVAYALSQLGGSGVVFVPETAAPNKIQIMRRLGAEVRTIGNDGLEAELAAREFANAEGCSYISPYNDPVVVAGQGSIAVEMEHQQPELDTVIASVGGGGLIGGMAAWFEQSMRTVRVIGASPLNSAIMADSVQAGRILEAPSLPTLSDGTAGGVEREAITFDLVRSSVDTWIKIPESEIGQAVVDCLQQEALLVEGAAGVAIAAARSLSESVRGTRIGIVVCGANIDGSVLKALLD